MSTPLYALGSRPLASAVTAVGTQGGKTAAAQTTPASGIVAARLPVVEATGFEDDNVSLSRQSLSRSGELAASTIDVAQKFIDTFVRKLFGGAAKGAQIAFDKVSIDASSSYSASEVSDGASRNQSFSLNESASFIGTGQIVTEDGRTFDFELEVKYEASIEAALESRQQADAPGQAAQSAQSTRPARLDAPDVVALTGKPLPAIEFPGSLSDLFKLLGRELRVAVDSEGKPAQEQGGDLTLRLLRLVDKAALLAPRVKPDAPDLTPAERNRLIASSYGSAPSTGELASA